MALQAKFLRMGKAGALAIYEVRGTSSELANFVSSNYKNSEPVFKSTPDGEPIVSNGNKVPLFFTSYPLPGKNLWHPLYKVQTGKNAGSWTLDKEDLQFEILASKSTGGDFGQAYAAAAANKYINSVAVSSSTSALLNDDEDEEEDFTSSESASEDATMDVEETSTTKAKTTK